MGGVLRRRHHLDSVDPVGTDGFFRWLVAGPTAPAGTATVLPLGSTTPLVRATANPETIIRSAPRIDVV